MEDSRGYVLLWRKFWDSDFLHERGRPFSKREAWLFLFSNLANGIERNGIPRGQFEVSIRYLSKAWLWPTTNVHRFLAKLLEEKMIEKVEHQTEHQTERFSVCNYDTYQTSRNTKRNTKRNKSKEGLKEGLKEQSDSYLKNDTHPPAPERPKNVPYEIFKAKFEAAHHSPYAGTKADFVQLAAMLKRYNLTSTDLPPSWEIACENYVHSDMGKFSLADLCQPGRYPVFMKAQLNSFGKPREKSLYEQYFAKH